MLRRTESNHYPQRLNCYKTMTPDTFLDSDTFLDFRLSWPASRFARHTERRQRSVRHPGSENS